MVKGRSIRYIVDFVAKKRGIEGLNKLLDRVNSKSVIFTDIEDIKMDENYPSYYFIRALNAAVAVLKDKELIEAMGRYFGENMNFEFRGIAGPYPPKKSVQTMVIYTREALPVFHTGYRTITDSTYWLGVSKISKEIYPFINGFMTSMFEAHGHIADVKRTVSESKVEYILKF
ncbi:MAG: hypothetical protein GXO25_07895 [Euryarchaeota archaeon]|nr:hypothetical protein [Euryarchaeota archaeon]